MRQRRTMDSAAMAKQLGTLSLLLVLVCASHLLMGPIPGVMAGPGNRGKPVVSVSPSTQTIGKGETAVVDINIADVTGLYGIDLRITFDPAVVQVVDANPMLAGRQVEPGALFDVSDGQGFVVENSADNKSGVIRYPATLLRPAAPVSGSGSLLRIVFEGIAAGGSPVTLDRVVLANSRAEKIPLATQDGSIMVQAATPTPTAEPEPQITMFRATPDTLVAGGSFLLEWRSVNATSAILFTDGLPHQGPVPPTGSIGFKDVPAGTYGLRLVVQNDADPPRTDQKMLVIRVAGQPGVITVDDGDAGFVRHGNPEFWWEADVGYRDHMIWTYVNGDSVSNWIEWHPDLPVCGDYTVSVYIPGQNATTQEARYEIYHTHSAEVSLTDESPRVIVVNQSTYFDEWIPLGTYRFERGRDGYVRLTDASGEDPNSLRKIAFDAVRWELQKRCASLTFLPLVLQQP